MRLFRGAIMGVGVALVAAPNWELWCLLMLLSIAYTIINDEIHHKIARDEFFISIQRSNERHGIIYGDREN